MRVINRFFINLNRTIVSSYLITLASLVFLKICHIQIPISLLLILILCTCLFLMIKNKPNPIILGVLGATASFALLSFLYKSFNIIFHVTEWDFLCFYLFGKLGASGLNFYDPVNIANVFSGLEIPFKVSEAFRLEIIQVGFWYPPPSMMMFIPLGYLNNIMTAKILWEIIILIFIVLDFNLLVRLIKTNDNKWINIFTILIITLVFPAAYVTVASSQTNFLLLFFLLLIYKDPEDWKSGLYLALSVIIKPIAAIWFLYFIINKKWAPLVSFILTGFLLLFISVLWFGVDNYVTYFTSPPTSRMPEFVFNEPANQSLLATISRFSIRTGLNFLVNYRGLLVIVISVIFTIVSCIISYYYSKSNSRFSFLIFIPLSLLIYPTSLSHYSILLLPIFLIIISKRSYLELFLFFPLIILVFLNSFFACLSLFLIIIIYSIPNTRILNFISNRIPKT